MGKSKSRMSISLFLDALKIVFNTSPDKKNTLNCYKVYIQARDVVEMERNMPKTAQEIVLSFWCFSAGVAMKELITEGTRSIILASGTLVLDFLNILRLL